MIRLIFLVTKAWDASVASADWEREPIEAINILKYINLGIKFILI